MYPGKSMHGSVARRCRHLFELPDCCGDMVVANHVIYARLHPVSKHQTAVGLDASLNHPRVSTTVFSVSTAPVLREISRLALFAGNCGKDCAVVGTPSLNASVRIAGTASLPPRGAMPEVVIVSSCAGRHALSRPYDRAECCENSLWSTATSCDRCRSGRSWRFDPVERHRVTRPPGRRDLDLAALLPPHWASQHRRQARHIERVCEPDRRVARAANVDRRLVPVRLRL